MPINIASVKVCYPKQVGSVSIGYVGKGSV